MVLEINYNDGQQIIRFYDQGNIGRENWVYSKKYYLRRPPKPDMEASIQS